MIGVIKAYPPTFMRHLTYNFKMRLEHIGEAEKK